MKKKLLELEMRSNGSCILHVRPHVGAEAHINMTDLLVYGYTGREVQKGRLQLSALQNAYMEQEEQP